MAFHDRDRSGSRHLGGRCAARQGLLASTGKLAAYPAGLKPAAVVLVATIRALKYHGGVDVKELGKENLEALAKGITNIERHVNNIRNNYGLPCVVSINHRTEARR